MTRGFPASDRRRKAEPTDGPAVLSVVAAPDEGPLDAGFTRIVGERLRSMVRWNDIVVPQGVDRFGLVCHEVPDEASALVIADRLDAGLTEPVVAGGRRQTVTASVGMAAQTMTDQRPVHLLDSADLARSMAVEWITEAVRDAALHHEAAIALFRPEASSLSEVRAFAESVADRVLGAGQLLLAGNGLLLVLPDVPVAEVLAMAAEVGRDEAVAVDTAAARLGPTGRPRHVTTGLPRR